MKAWALAGMHPRLPPVKWSPTQPITLHRVPSSVVAAAVACFEGRNKILRKKRGIHTEELAGKEDKPKGVQCGPQPHQTLSHLGELSRENNI